MVFDLKVQSAKEPRDNSAAPSEVHCGLRLMDGPRALDTPGFLQGQRKLRLLHAVRHLEHDAQHGSRDQPGDHIVDQDSPNGMKPKRNSEGHGEEDRFAGNENCQLPPVGARESLRTDPAADEL